MFFRSLLDAVSFAHAKAIIFSIFFDTLVQIYCRSGKNGEMMRLECSFVGHNNCDPLRSFYKNKKRKKMFRLLFTLIEVGLMIIIGSARAFILSKFKWVKRQDFELNDLNGFKIKRKKMFQNQMISSTPWNRKQHDKKLSIIKNWKDVIIDVFRSIWLKSANLMKSIRHCFAASFWKQFFL